MNQEDKEILNSQGIVKPIDFYEGINLTPELSSEEVAMLQDYSKKNPEYIKLEEIQEKHNFRVTYRDLPRNIGFDNYGWFISHYFPTILEDIIEDNYKKCKNKLVANYGKVRSEPDLVMTQKRFFRLIKERAYDAAVGIFSGNQIYMIRQSDEDYFENYVTDVFQCERQNFDNFSKPTIAKSLAISYVYNRLIPKKQCKFYLKRMQQRGYRL